MSKVKFIIKPKSELGKILLFPELELVQPFTILAGANGVGKSSLSHQFEPDASTELVFKLEDDYTLTNGNLIVKRDSPKPIQTHFYCNSLYNPNMAACQRRNEIRGYDIYAFSNKFECELLSEGEASIHNFDQWYNYIKYKAKDNEFSKDFIHLFILDEMDSGLSINNVIRNMNRLQWFYHRYSKKFEMYFIITANNYEIINLAKGAISMYDGKYFECDDKNHYHDYFWYKNTFIKDNEKFLQTRRRRNRLYGCSIYNHSIDKEEE